MLVLFSLLQWCPSNIKERHLRHIMPSNKLRLRAPHMNTCFFPDQWASRILYEISSQETVRDSTLRRSTGYALGLLSLMRTQPSLATSSSAGLCQSILAQIVRYSLPSATVMGKNLAKWAGNVSARVEDIFTFLSLGQNILSSPDMFVSDERYEVRQHQIPIYLTRSIDLVSSHLPGLISIIVL